MSVLFQRMIGVVVTFLLGWGFLWPTVQSSWTNYWLLKDAKEGTAIITETLSHGVVRYGYTVNGSDYVGSSQRNWQQDKFRNVRVGEESVVYFSATRPALSRLSMPDAVVEGLPVFLLALFFEWFALATAINPRSRWAFNLHATKR